METSKKIETMAARSESSVDNGGASINQITTKTQKIMENNNKCFFSVSLKNGVTLINEDPIELRNFLRDCWSGFYEAYKTATKMQLNYVAKHYYELYRETLKISINLTNNFEEE